jgi:hypothetical protein
MLAAAVPLKEVECASVKGIPLCPFFDAPFGGCVQELNSTIIADAKTAHFGSGVSETPINA